MIKYDHDEYSRVYVTFCDARSKHVNQTKVLKENYEEKCIK